MATKHFKCSCGDENCSEELEVTKWDDGVVTFFGFEVDLTPEQVDELIAFLQDEVK
jgi:hypothetical protein